MSYCISIVRTSTPITEETDAAFAEKKRAKKHFLYLISLILQTSEHPSYPYVSIPTTPPSQNFPIFGSTTVIYNRMNAELARKQAYANIYSGPISNRGFAPIHFQH